MCDLTHGRCESHPLVRAHQLHRGAPFVAGWLWPLTIVCTRWRLALSRRRLTALALVHASRGGGSSRSG